MAAARAIASGSLPPSCSATGCSASEKPRMRSRSPCSTAPVVTISVYSRTRRETWRRKNRQCRSVQSIIGATERRCVSTFEVMAAV
jgi:hypothetical protein